MAPKVPTVDKRLRSEAKDYRFSLAQIGAIMGVASYDPMMFRFLARARAGEEAAAELEANAARLKTKQWPFAAIELLAGKRTPDATLSVAVAPNDVCEANFYIGQWHILRGDKPAAAKFLKVAVDTCPKTFIEFTGAVAELKRLQP